VAYVYVYIIMFMLEDERIYRCVPIIIIIIIIIIINNNTATTTTTTTTNCNWVVIRWQ